MWSKLFTDRHINWAYSAKHCDLIENMLYNLLKQRTNTEEFQNIALEAILRWIYYYLPQINGTQTAATAQVTKLSATLLQIPAFRIYSRYIHSMANVGDSHQLCYFMLHQMVNSNTSNPRTMKPSTLSDIKCILSHTANNGYSEDSLFIALQVIEVCFSKSF